MHRWIVAIALTGLMGCGTTGAALKGEQQREGVASASVQLEASVLTASLAQRGAIGRSARMVLGRFNPATCECPPYEVFLSGRWERVWLEESGYVVLKMQAPLDGEPVQAAEGPGKETGPLLASEVDALKRSIEGAPFNEGKLQLLQEGIDGRTLTAVQAEGLLELFSFSRDRVDVLVFLHPKLEPEEDFWRLLLALKFESDRQAVRDRIGQES